MTDLYLSLPNSYKAQPKFNRFIGWHQLTVEVYSHCFLKILNVANGRSPLQIAQKKSLLDSLGEPPMRVYYQVDCMGSLPGGLTIRLTSWGASQEGFLSG
jgi:hypothetical protein